MCRKSSQVHRKFSFIPRSTKFSLASSSGSPFCLFIKAPRYRHPGRCWFSSSSEFINGSLSYVPFSLFWYEYLGVHRLSTYQGMSCPVGRIFWDSPHFHGFHRNLPMLHLTMWQLSCDSPVRPASLLQWLHNFPSFEGSSDP